MCQLLRRGRQRDERRFGRAECLIAALLGRSLSVIARSEGDTAWRLSIEEEGAGLLFAAAGVLALVAIRLPLARELILIAAALIAATFKGF